MDSVILQQTEASSQSKKQSLAFLCEKSCSQNFISENTAIESKYLIKKVYLHQIRQKAAGEILNKYQFSQCICRYFIFFTRFIHLIFLIIYNLHRSQLNIGTK